jgi:hypothetical protein
VALHLPIMLRPAPDESKKNTKHYNRTTSYTTPFYFNSLDYFEIKNSSTFIYIYIYIS